MNHSTTGTALKNEDNIVEHVKSAMSIMLTNIETAWKRDGGDGETSQCMDAGSAYSRST